MEDQDVAAYHHSSHLSDEELEERTQRVQHTPRSRFAHVTVQLTVPSDLDHAKGAAHLRLCLDPTVLSTPGALRLFCEQLRSRIEEGKQTLDQLVSFSVEGASSAAVVDLLLSHAPHVAVVDLSQAYPCTQKLVEVCSLRLVSLHELHLNFMPHRLCSPEEIVDWLAQDSGSTLEHVEIHECEAQSCAPLYSLPNLVRLAFHHFKSPSLSLVGEGYDRAEVWDEEKQAYSTESAWTQEHGYQTLFLTRTLPVLKPSQRSWVGPGCAEAERMDAGNRLEPPKRWGYVDHSLALAQASFAACNT